MNFQSIRLKLTLSLFDVTYCLSIVSLLLSTLSCFSDESQVSRYIDFFSLQKQTKWALICLTKAFHMSSCNVCICRNIKIKVPVRRTDTLSGEVTVYFFIHC